ncbi:MAG: hypothetical protein Fur0022_03500 [Anaerolineales bacterium]
MEQEHLLILDLLDEGKISVSQALELIEAVDKTEPEYYTLNACEETITVQVYLN